MAEWLDLNRNDFIAQWYAEEYETSTYGGPAGQVQRWMHTSLEAGYQAHTRFPRTIELGANLGEHVKWVRHSFDSYVVSDVSPRVLESRVGQEVENVQLLCADARELPLATESFDRVLHTCLLHHVTEPEDVLCEIRRLLKPGGTGDLFLSSDPGMLFRFARFLGPYSSARRKGLGSVKNLVDARDHRNHVGGLLRLVKHVFRNDDVRVKSYPFPGMTWNSSLWFTMRVVKG